MVPKRESPRPSALHLLSLRARLTGSYREIMAAKAAVAAQRVAGSKEIPEGAPNCLEGLTFVFTGELQTLGRDEATELVKRYSG